MNANQGRILKERVESVIERWRHIKAKARTNNRITNIEKNAPCLSAALNQMEVYLRLLEAELQREKTEKG